MGTIGASLNLGTRDRKRGEPDTAASDFAARVRANQREPTAKLKSHYDFIVCGSGRQHHGALRDHRRARGRDRETPV